jgi:hypothetical protein
MGVTSYHIAIFSWLEASHQPIHVEESTGHKYQQAEVTKAPLEIKSAVIPALCTPCLINAQEPGANLTAQIPA